jgi:hypothetical protein
MSSENRNRDWLLVQTVIRGMSAAIPCLREPSVFFNNEIASQAPQVHKKCSGLKNKSVVFISGSELRKSWHPEALWMNL